MFSDCPQTHLETISFNDDKLFGIGVTYTQKTNHVHPMWFDQTPQTCHQLTGCHNLCTGVWDDIENTRTHR